jgi:hypothetical protein
MKKKFTQQELLFAKLNRQFRSELVIRYHPETFIVDNDGSVGHQFQCHVPDDDGLGRTASHASRSMIGTASKQHKLSTNSAIGFAHCRKSSSLRKTRT